MKNLINYKTFRILISILSIVLYVLGQYGYVNIGFLECLIISMSPTIAFFIVFIFREIFETLELIVNILMF